MDMQLGAGRMGNGGMERRGGREEQARHQKNDGVLLAVWTLICSSDCSGLLALQVAHGSDNDARVFHISCDLGSNLRGCHHLEPLSED